MATLNPFNLLDDDSEDPSQIVAAKPLKVEKSAPVQPAKSGKFPTKPAPPTQAVREAKNGPAGGRGGGRGGGNGRGRGGGYNRDSRNTDAPANENGYGGGYNRRSEEGDGARRGGSVGGYRGDRGARGARRGGFNNGESGDFERPRRNFERHSGTGHGSEFKRDGAGRGNWGTTEDDIAPVTDESTAAVEKNVTVEKQGGEGEATDANKETPAEEQPEKEPENKEMTLEEYEKVLEEKKKALQATKVEERKVDTKAFEAMQQLSSKKSNNDEVFIKLGTEKDKRVMEREEKTKKSLSINEFLKPANGERYYPRGGYRGGRGGRGQREGNQKNGGAAGPNEGGRGQRGGGNQNYRAPANEGGRGQRGGNPRYREPAAPAIEDTAQFPTLGK
ncbi:PREDICTED: plasminogen activator inhibitor 1 RNA-binding protein-like [Camelina sativa]|uniref:Plasminogen activator inhibitor 1 RNA-binding protein-like n=1 Tax=Camelina sativa TaxID=90675 RepID=A0ABM0U1Z3_CAMSA|nr:PREDICTED: plasminogen activator inhibitor 1 RNA-binding protein-like [Camelina sativa]